ncbi:ATP-dependent 6-phosphofructokinase [Treponema sp.]|uniref:6-phosphofructokinase n=1 Tax=Treponema sp. TaxID=166 RepID=UPI00298EB3ED|nr:ATP-dependent 6-phosphofructokinase [Treponema sp.]MCR5613519.1 6-phosphofructokinase [Treponema sp.]
MKKSVVKTIGILTSGGDAPGLNAAIRGVCEAGINEYGMKVVGIKNGYKGFEQGLCMPITKEDLPELLLRGGTILGSTREKPFKNKEVDPKTGLSALDLIKKNYKKWKLDALVVLGGNGSNTTAGLLADEGLNVIGLPKTIDNDIVHTDYTFGFHTAIDTAAEALDKIRTTAFSHSRVMVVEVMGHKVGWLGLCAGIAGGADVILLPEIPYDIKKITRKILDNKKNGKNYSIVVVSEGAQNTEEAKLDKKAFKKLRSTMTCSIGERVAKEIEEATGLETRCTILGHLQRGGQPNSYDRFMATLFGTTAADYLARGEFGKILVWQNHQIVGIPLGDVAAQAKSVSLDEPLIKSARSTGISFGD